MLFPENTGKSDPGEVKINERSREKKGITLLQSQGPERAASLEVVSTIRKWGSIKEQGYESIR